MANEIEFTSGLKINKLGLFQTSTPSTKNQTLESTLLGNVTHETQVVATSYEDVGIGDVSTAAVHIMRLLNRSTTATVTVQVITGAASIPCGVMRPGEPFGPIAIIARTAGYPKWQMVSSAADTPVEVLVCEAGDPTA